MAALPRERPLFLLALHVCFLQERQRKYLGLSPWDKATLGMVSPHPVSTYPVPMSLAFGPLKKALDHTDPLLGPADSGCVRASRAALKRISLPVVWGIGLREAPFPRSCVRAGQQCLSGKQDDSLSHGAHVKAPSARASP